jgi:SDR family mycofactocin-dependent oxidoreductase
MGRLDGKVAFITGAARGQGRSHALRLAEEGADIIALDICDRVRSNVAPPATEEDLAETVKEVEARDRRIVSSVADVRNFAAVKAAVENGVAELGRLDVVVANAGVWTYGPGHELTEEEWGDVIDVNLTGVWHTCKAAIPTLIEQGNGGAITITSSVMGLEPTYNLSHYVAAKHGTVGLMKTLALELAPHSIRVNTVNPGTVNTKLVHNEPTYALFAPDLTDPTREQIAERMGAFAALPVPWVEPVDVSNAVLFLSSDEARYITGVALPVDAGVMVK